MSGQRMLHRGRKWKGHPLREETSETWASREGGEEEEGGILWIQVRTEKGKRKKLKSGNCVLLRYFSQERRKGLSGWPRITFVWTNRRDGEGEAKDKCLGWIAQWHLLRTRSRDRITHCCGGRQKVCKLGKTTPQTVWRVILRSQPIDTQKL